MAFLLVVGYFRLANTLKDIMDSPQALPSIARLRGNDVSVYLLLWVC